jgi:polyphosphate kinase
MTRNMIKRVEILFPILDPFIKERIMNVILLQMLDTAKSREQDEHGEYHYCFPNKHEEIINSQEELLKLIYRVSKDEE